MIRSMQQVLEWREKKCRLALARVTRSVEKRRNGIQAMDQFLTAVESQIDSTLNARLAGPSTVAQLTELEQHTQTLRSQRERLVDMKRQAEHVLEDLLKEQQQHAQEWRRCEAQRTHVAALAKQERIQRAIVASEREEEIYAEHRVLAGGGS